jgi:secreted PhoX family phosphatase
MERRDFIKGSLLSGGVLALGASWSMLSHARAEASPYGPLLAADANGLQLPAGFTSRVVATTGQTVPGTAYAWHAAPDGGACFPSAGGGWIYVSNSEAAPGGAGMVRFDGGGAVVDAHRILSGTVINCAGGPTPWGTWLSCEEIPLGQVWECDPNAVNPGVARPAMGRFKHEAAAVDPGTRVVYLTEDEPDGALYRFVPTAYPDLSSGVLEVMTDAGGGAVAWAVVPDPDGSPVTTRNQVAGTRRFNGGEGAWFSHGVLRFTTKGDGRVWRYTPATDQLVVEYDDSTAVQRTLTGVDNVTVAATSGDVFVAEDGGNMEICLLVSDGAVPFLHVTGVSGSEITGPAFDPSGTRLYFSSQRNPGRTYEVRGPFRGTGPPPSTTSTAGVTTTTTGPPIVLTATVKKRRVTLRWTGAQGNQVRVEREGSIITTTANDGSHNDQPRRGTYHYRILELSGRASNCVLVGT